MRYNPEDKEEFKKQINELLTLKLIRPNQLPHSSPAFMVRNHAEIVRGKDRMVINYKKLNDNTIYPYIIILRILRLRKEGPACFHTLFSF